MIKTIKEYYLDISPGDLPPIGEMLICYDIPELETDVKTHFHETGGANWGKRYCLLVITESFPDVIIGGSTPNEIYEFLNKVEV